MPINPIRVNPLEVPANPRPVPLDFSFIADLGKSIGAYRDRQEVGRIMQGAIGPDGNLDLNKAATALAVSGRDPELYLKSAVSMAGERRAEQAQRALEQHYRTTETEAARANRESERLRQLQLEQPQFNVIPQTLMSPGYLLQTPRRPGEAPVYHPLQPPPAPAPTPGPSSALPVPGPNLAAAEPNPEEAPPYRVAGPPTPPPSQPGATAPAAAAAAPAATPARNEAYLAKFPPAAQTWIKGVAEYELDPDKLTGRDREDVIAAAKIYRRDYNAGEFQKRASPPSGEIAARVGLSKAFFDKLADRTTEDGRVIPGIKSRIAGGELTGTLSGRGLAMLGQGNPGELRSAIDEGAEALLRGLTGAGMSANEAANYARRYQFSAIDTTDTMVKKVDQLENALRYVVTEVGKGRGGDDVLKGFIGKFGQGVAVKPVANEGEANALISQARAALQRDPSARAEIINRLRQRGIPTPERLLGQ